MTRVENSDPLLPSVLDRLIDEEPDVSTEPAWKQSQTLLEMKRSVRRDLESLLNTRQTIAPETDFRETAQSVLTYGLPDLSTALADSLEHRELYRQLVEEAIQRFEPRLRQVRVALLDPTNKFDRTLRLIVDAYLWVEPNPEPVVFDTVVRPYNAQCEVRTRE